MNEVFSESARDGIRAAIAAAQGNEVFLIGETEASPRVERVVVAARGSREAVPAVTSRCSFGDVVIHNHPSGDLRPSAPDLEIAGRLAGLGVAFYIVDNPVENVYKVVEPFPPRRTLPIDFADLEHILAPHGRMAAVLPSFEERPEQLRMAFLVAEAFNQDKLALVEAGTGTGKSLAYLAPAILWAAANGERVIVSTNTINLQEQLLGKDLPLLRRATGRSFKTALIKGRSQYLCRRRLEGARQEPGLFEDRQQQELAQIWDWSLETEEGSRSGLPFVPSDPVWEEVCCEADQCLRVRCPHFGACFFHRARRQAAQADLLVANHALVLTDLAIRTQTGNFSAAAILPPCDRLILDEAHHLEDVATRFFSMEVTRFSFARPLHRLRHPRKTDKGFLAQLLVKLATLLPAHENVLYARLFEKVQELGAGCQELYGLAVTELEGIAETLRAFSDRRGGEPGELRFRITETFAASDSWETIRGRVEGLAGETRALVKGVRELLTECEALEEGFQEQLLAAMTDIGAAAGRLERLAEALRGFVLREASLCAWIEVAEGRIGRGRGTICRLCSAPLEVATLLREALFDRHRTVIMTSATLAVGSSFRYLKERVGLDAVETGRLLELRLPSPFDFQRQALVAVPRDLPEPGSDGYPRMVRDLCERAIIAADGRTFVLFTAYSLLKTVFAETAPVLGARGYHCLRQGDDDRHRLLKSFTEDSTSVLFATDSFWEGVDVPGRSLEQIIITRLPFRVPTDPVLEARAEALEQAGGDPFREYTVPQAVIRFKQGFGRLIRSRTDRGVVLILDSRVVNKNYGRIFLDSLPGPCLVSGGVEEVFAAVERFFAASKD
ncbi:MAG: helicase [Deltaproteobacteria bacterium]|nr:helicase [Deltaproteobacteria bacterium]